MHDDLALWNVCFSWHCLAVFGVEWPPQTLTVGVNTDARWPVPKRFRAFESLQGHFVTSMSVFCAFSHLLESSSESECETDEDSTCSSSSDSEVFDVIAEIKRKKAHPDRLHDELWYNDPGQVRLRVCFCSDSCRPSCHGSDSCRPSWHVSGSGPRRCMLTGIEAEPYSQGREPSFRAVPFCFRVQLQGVSPEQLVSSCLSLTGDTVTLFSVEGGGSRKVEGGKSLRPLKSSTWRGLAAK